MKRIVSLVATALGVACVACYAMQATDAPGEGKEAGISISSRASLCILNGTARETVYVHDKGYRHKLSELIWDLENLYFLGTVVSVELGNKYHVNAGLWIPLNEGSGQMEDFDRLFIVPGSPWTDWSLSNVDVTEAWMLDINGSLELARKYDVSLRAMLGYKYSHWAWEDSGVAFIYSTDPSTLDGFRDSVGTLDHTVAIEYEQSYGMPYVGLTAFFMHEQMSFSTYLTYSPFVWATDEDYHVLRETFFNGSFSAGNYIGLGFSSAYTLANNTFLAISLDMQFVPEISGNVTISDTESDADFWMDGCAVEHESIMISLSAGKAF